MSPALSCADRSGFLFAHACDRPASGACSVCHKPICMEHTRMGAGGATCITCLRDDDDDADADDDDADDDGAAARDNDAPAGRGEDDPYFYGGRERAAYYDADDYRAFDSAPDQSPGLETDTGGS